MLTNITQWSIEVVYSFGYVGLFLLTALGNMNLLIPTQLTLPLAGFLVGQGRFSLILVLAASTSGSVVGSLALYLLGRWSSESMSRLTKRIKKFDKLAFVLDLSKASTIFARHGRETILIGRFVPGTGAPISVLAGLKRLPIWQFTTYTALGSALWNAGFVGLGWAFGAEWPLVKQYALIIEYALLICIAGGILLFLWRRWKSRISIRNT
jgi:membrane protein DedA with SNARE-associated domain